MIRPFEGEGTDISGGLYYLRARYYDPAIGGFLSRDPLPAANLYAYVYNRPACTTPASGRFPQADTLIPDAGDQARHQPLRPKHHR